ncbi:MAG: dihydropyrimidinase [Marinilabiliales bacterium]|nr:MAG: dihydropyrimidinase [Marinilabiliales bacterium]
MKTGNSVLIRNGIIVGAHTIVQSDIFIENGKIKTIGRCTDKADRIIDADGYYVTPGGVDPHVHFHLPTPAGFSADNFHSGTLAALAGGTTTIIDFVTPERNQSYLDAYQKRMEEAKGALADYSFHMSPTWFGKDSEKEIAECISLGMKSFKVYTAYQDAIGIDYETIGEVMKAVKANHGILLAHCEDEDIIKNGRKEVLKLNIPEQEKHPLSRKSEAEIKAIEKIISLAQKTACPVYVVHISTGKGAGLIAEAQRNHIPVYGETCPQYLLLDERKYRYNFSNSSVFVMSPPLRKSEDNKELWKFMINGGIQSVGTDHCPFMLGQKQFGAEDFRKIPNGAGGVENRMALLYTYGVLEEKITLNQWVQLCSTNPAHIFGLSSRKGDIKEGLDADLVVLNPEKGQTIHASTHQSKADVSVYEGMKTKASQEYVLRRGEIVLDRGKLIDEISSGEFIKQD